jgi:hypothetical protein
MVPKHNPKFAEAPAINSKQPANNRKQDDRKQKPAASG